jgi:dolichyl-phosphate-mannose--protein O-mannosyl transferase
MRRIVFIQAIISILSLATILAKDEPVLVTCGSFLKLEHVKTGHLLHSQDVAYGMGRGSGQQGVTGYPDRDSSSSLWIVRGVGVGFESSLYFPSYKFLKIYSAILT